MFNDRFDAGEQLASLLQTYKTDPETVILAVPRGGIEVGYILAKRLHLPLDIIFTKKIGYPSNPEYAMGAVSSRHIFMNEQFKHSPELQKYVETQAREIRKNIHEREKLYRKGLAPLQLKDKIVIVVDDGVATGNTILATVALLREDAVKKIIVALPVCAKDAYAKIAAQADEVVCVILPSVFYSVGQFYRHFDQVTDEQAIKLLHEANV